MASQITSGSQVVSLLSSNVSQNAEVRNREAGASRFSDVLRGQLRGSDAAPRQDATPAPDRSEQKRSEQPRASEDTREARRTRERPAEASETERSDTSESSVEDGMTASEGKASTTNEPSADAAPADTAKEPANPTAPDKVEPAPPIAGLPAEIAALLSAASARPNGSVSITSGNDTDPSVEVDLAGKIALTGDTQGKPLQNPGDPRQQAALNFAQTAADQGKAAVPLQLKPEAQSGFAERAATALNAVSADAPDGAQVSFMHALRHPGQITTSTPQLAVSTPAGQSAWADDVGSRVMWMVGRAESKAELVLTPPHLGKVEVSINLNGDQTTAQFVAATQSARDALEQAMPRLREILAQSGISLGQANVSTSGDQQASDNERGRGGNRGSGTGGVETGGGVSAAQWTKQAEGLVDTFV